MRRAYGSLTLWVVLIFVLPWTPGRPVQGQVDVDWIPRQGTLSTAELVATLEKSQSALLQARQAVDSALLDIDEALASLRGAAPDEMADALPEPEEESPAEEGSFSRLASRLESFRAYLGEAIAGGLDEMTYAVDAILEEIALQAEEPESPEAAPPLNAGFRPQISIRDFSANGGEVSAEDPMALSDALEGSIPGLSSPPEPQTPAVAETSSSLDEASPAPDALESAVPDEGTGQTPSSLEASPAIEAEAGAAMNSQESPAQIVPSSSPTNEGQPAPAPSPEAGTEEPVKKEPMDSPEEKTEAVPAKEPCRAEEDYGESSSRHRPCGESIPALP